MVKPSDSNPPNPPDPEKVPAEEARVPAEQELRRGIAALKARRFNEALAIFDGLEQASPTLRTKAQMGKVQAFQRQGNVPQAQQHCQGLLTHPSPRVRQWAQQVLEQLPESNREISASTNTPDHTQRNPEQAPEDKSGFVPLESSSKQGGQPPPQELDTGGKDPFEQAADPQTGFTPTQDSPHPVRTDLPAGEASEALSPAPDARPSLFHYQQLNQSMAPGAEVNSPPFPVGDESPQVLESRPIDPLLSAASPHVPPARKQTGQKPASVSASTGRLQPQRPYRLWAVQLLTGIVALWLIHWGLHQSLQGLNQALRFIFQWPFRFSGFDVFDRPHLRLVFIVGIAVILASPWLLDGLLGWLYGQQALSSRSLQQHHSEALRLLRRVCRQRQWQLPELRLLPDSVPMSFSYGWSPRTARIVVSQGLLDSLTDEELSALYGYELAHMVNWDLPVLSGLSVLLGLLYSGYWHLARWGNQRQNKWLWGSVSIVASLIYGIFWLLQKVGLWLSRMRAEYCDRTALALFPHPNQYQQLQLALTRQISQDVARRGGLHPLLAGFSLLMPFSPHQAVSPGSFVDRVGVSRLVAEDCLNPYRYWLVANRSHPIPGERLLLLEQWARSWQIPAIGLTLEQLTTAGEPTSSPELATPHASSKLPSQPAKSITVRDLILQNSPLIGLVVGGSIALGLWFLGGVVNRFNWQQLSWLYQDGSILRGGLLIGLGMGILMRINRLFSERTPLQVDVANIDAALFQRPPTLPVNGYPVTVQGTLIGGDGILNSLCQTFYVQAAGGMLALKFTSPLDWWRSLRPSRQHPSAWTGRQARITGWLRRAGGHLWIDVNSLQVAGKSPFRVHAPQWTTGLGIGLCVGGIWTIFSG